MIQDDYVNIFQVAMQKMSLVWLYDEKKVVSTPQIQPINSKKDSEWYTQDILVQ